MKQLSTQFRKDGFDFALIERTQTVALYSKAKPEWIAPSYEVVRIQAVKAKTLFGRQVDAHEALPSSEQWGVNGWTYPDLARAKAKLVSLARKEQNRLCPV